MDLVYSEKETTFRREVRAWLESNVPTERLPTFDRPDGFEAHRAWEQKLNAGGYAMVSWPREFGGLGGHGLHADLCAAVAAPSSFP